MLFTILMLHLSSLVWGDDPKDKPDFDDVNTAYLDYTDVHGSLSIGGKIDGDHPEPFIGGKITLTKSTPPTQWDGSLDFSLPLSIDAHLGWKWWIINANEEPKPIDWGPGERPDGMEETEKRWMKEQVAGKESRYYIGLKAFYLEEMQRADLNLSKDESGVRPDSVFSSEPVKQRLMGLLVQIGEWNLGMTENNTVAVGFDAGVGIAQFNLNSPGELNKTLTGPAAEFELYILPFGSSAGLTGNILAMKSAGDPMIVHWKTALSVNIGKFIVSGGVGSTYTDRGQPPPEQMVIDGKNVDSLKLRKYFLSLGFNLF